MAMSTRSAAERTLRILVRDEHWDELKEAADEARQDASGWASVQLERILIRRKKAKKLTAEVA
jgi:hypothetical protein